MEPSSTAHAERQQLITQQEVVADLSQRVVETEDVESLLHDAVAAVADTLATEYGAVLELPTGSDEALLREGVGWRSGLVGTAAVSTDLETHVGCALGSAEPVIVEDLRREGHRSGSDLLMSHDAVSGIGASIGPVEEPWGVLGVYSSEPRAFTDQDANFVRSVANLLASAVENERTRNELGRSEQCYRVLVEHFPNGAVALVDTDLRYRIVGGSPVGAPATGDDLAGQSVREAIPDELADTLVPRYRAALDGDASTLDYEHGGRHAHVDVVPVRDEQGEVFAAMAISQDITDRAQAEQNLRDSEERFRSMMEQSPFSIQIFDPEGRTIAANPAWERLWEASREELADYNILEDEQLEEAGVLPGIRDAFRGEVVTLPVTYYDPAEIGKPGRARWIEGYAYPLLPRDGETQEIALVHHDITDRKEREQELRRIRERMEFALTATDAVVWDWNVEDDQASFYPSEESLYGTTVDNWEDFVGIIHPEDREKVQQGIEQALETGEPKYEEVRIIRDGRVRWIEAPGQPVQDDDGSTRMIGVARDITERKTYERKLKESVERLEQFAHAASHDLQEPLRMVSSYLQLIEQRYADELDEDGKEFIEFAVDGSDRMREMIDSLLAYSRIETQGKSFEPVDLNTVLEDALTDLQVRIHESGAEIRAEDLPRVEGDANQLRELVQNLLSNAIEYSGDAPPSVDISAERDGATCVVSVKDDGIGIDPANHDIVFKVFERLHSRDEHPGTGIGLALCNRIIERHGGDLWVDSELGQGATFHFSLPQKTSEE